MVAQINWETNLDIALNRSVSEHKAVFLDFFNPQ